MSEQSNIRIVYIEDAIDWHFLLKTILTPLDIELICYTELARGIEDVKKNSTDLVMLDLDLPDSNFNQTITTFNEQVTATPVIVVTTFDKQTLSDFLPVIEVDGFLTKSCMRAIDLVQVFIKAVTHFYNASDTKLGQLLFKLQDMERILLAQKE
jgi:DNA-binding response OmpR family regulator